MQTGGVSDFRIRSGGGDKKAVPATAAEPRRVGAQSGEEVRE